MKEPRNCCAVIRQMLERVPVDKVDLIEALKWNHEDASYKAPEQTEQWLRTQETLETNIKLPQEDWELEVISIFTMIPVDKLRVYAETSMR